MDEIGLAKRLIADHFAVPLEKVHDDAHFGFDLGADSLDVLELTMRLEDEFAVTIDDDESETCQTVGQACQMLAFKIRGKAKSAA